MAMILGRLADIIKQYWALIYARQWANWQLLTIAAVATVLFILLVVRWRRLKEADGKLKNVRMIARQPGLTDNQRIQLLQREIVKRDHTEARLEREVSELTAANEQLQRMVTELTSANQQLRQEDSGDGLSSKQRTAELMLVNEQLRQEVSASKRACERSEQKIAALGEDNKQLQDRITELTRDNERLRRESRRVQESSEQKIAELTLANEQLRQEIAVSKKACEHSKQEIAELAAANKQLRDKITDLASANEQLRQEDKGDEQSSAQKMTELTLVNEQLQQELAASQEACRRSRQEIAELLAADERLRHEAVEQRRTRGKGIGSRQKEEASRVEKMVSISEISLKAKSPAQQLKELAEEVIDSNIQKGISGSPGTKAVLDACDYLDADNAAMAVEALKRFINAVEAQQRNNDEIPQKEEAEDWIAAARGVIHLLTVE